MGNSSSLLGKSSSIKQDNRQTFPISPIVSLPLSLKNDDHHLSALLLNPSNISSFPCSILMKRCSESAGGSVSKAGDELEDDLTLLQLDVDSSNVALTEFDVKMIKSLQFDFLLPEKMSPVPLSGAVLEENRKIEKPSNQLASSKLSNTVNWCNVGMGKVYELYSDPLFFLNCECITQLNVCCNNLRHLPDDFGIYLKNLQVLSLEKNSLSQLPWSLCLLSSLRELNISRNKLECLPAGFSAVTITLRVLLAQFNFIQWLPEDIFSMISQLSYVDVSYNPIALFPPIRTGTLKKIIVEGCPLMTKFPKSSHINASDADKISIIVDDGSEKADTGMCQWERALQGCYKQFCENIAVQNPQYENDSNSLVLRTLSGMDGELLSPTSDATVGSHPRFPQTTSKLMFDIPKLKEFAARGIYRNMISIPCYLPSSLISYLGRVQTCSCCDGPYFDSWTPRVKEKIARGEAQLPVLYRLCWPHWNTKNERIKSLFQGRPLQAPRPSYHLDDLFVYWSSSLKLLNINSIVMKKSLYQKFIGTVFQKKKDQYHEKKFEPFSAQILMNMYLLLKFSCNRGTKKKDYDNPPRPAGDGSYTLPLVVLSPMFGNFLSAFGHGPPPHQ